MISQYMSCGNLVIGTFSDKDMYRSKTLLEIVNN